MVSPMALLLRPLLSLSPAMQNPLPHLSCTPGSRRSCHHASPSSEHTPFLPSGIGTSPHSVVYTDVYPQLVPLTVALAAVGAVVIVPGSSASSSQSSSDSTKSTRHRRKKWMHHSRYSHLSHYHYPSDDWLDPTANASVP